MGEMFICARRFFMVVFFAVGAIVVAEALWWNSARDSYPGWLMSEAPINAVDLLSLREACGDPLEVERGDADLALVRCGTFWPMRSVWRVPKSHVAPTLR